MDTIPEYSIVSRCRVWQWGGSGEPGLDRPTAALVKLTQMWLSHQLPVQVEFEEDLRDTQVVYSVHELTTGLDWSWL
jgi:hypothetical protein